MGFWESLKYMRLEAELERVQENLEHILIHKRHLIKKIKKCKELFAAEESDESDNSITELTGD